VPRDEFSAMLVVEHVDAFATVQLDDARQFSPAQPLELDCGFLRLMLAGMLACRIVEALDAAAESKRRSARSGRRRSPASA
jgi:hypothetical protein